MKVGDLYLLDDASGWYIWLKHKFQWQENSPMNLEEGCWIIGIHAGTTAMQALQQGEIGELVDMIPRRSPITRIGNLSLDDADIHWPAFYEHISDGQGGMLVYLCKGYERLKQVKRMRKDVRFSFGLTLQGLVQHIKSETLESAIAHQNLDISRPKIR